MIDRKNPIITVNHVPIDKSKKYNIDEDEFMLAVSAENHTSGELLSDPSYVRWVTRYVEKKNGLTSRHYHLMHKCSDKEFERFEPSESD